jgi:hypothetical protein
MVFIHNIGFEIPVELLLVLTTGYAIVFFHALRFKTCLKTYKKVQMRKGSYIGVLGALSLLWIGSFAISVYFSASIYILFATAWSGLFGAMCLGIFEKKKLYIYKTLALAILIIFSYTVLFFSDSISPLMFVLMVISTSITGIAMFSYFKFSHHLNDIGLDSINVLMVRFWGIFLLSLGYTIYTKSWLIISPKILGTTLFLAVCSIVPVYFSQKSVEAIGSNKTSMLVTSTPFITFLLELLFTHNPVTSTGILSILFVGITIAFYSLQLRRQ